EIEKPEGYLKAAVFESEEDNTYKEPDLLKMDEWNYEQTFPYAEDTAIQEGFVEEEGELPIQPVRCTQLTTLYERSTYELFLKDVKKWIRTCVQEGRENELLDNNPSIK